MVEHLGFAVTDSEGAVLPKLLPQFSPKLGHLSSTIIPLKASYCHTSRVVGLSDDSALVCDKLPTGVSVGRERPMSDDNVTDRHR